MAARYCEQLTSSSNTIRSVDANGVSRGLRTLLGRGIGIDESRVPQYISNLDRLGILRIDWSLRADDEESYDTIEKLVDAERGIPSGGRVLRAGVILVTPLGGEFLATCVGVRVELEAYS